MTATYDIASMVERLSELEEQFRVEFREFLRNLGGDGLTTSAIKDFPQTELYHLTDYDSLKSVYGNPGFYVILTDHAIENNECTLTLDIKYAAIYRGECSAVKKRIESHLFNKRHDEEHSQHPNKTHYSVCMKIVEHVSGINIDEDEYKNSTWYVLVFKMPKSSSAIRKQMEKAFDAVFKQPVASRD